ncbi:putative Vacuolar protein sorting-associated protein 13a [Paratrimastix pyriformis]|uniref:Vacuolar protein sorting-associated protein 13a n=1 Tax=Paratrimastix pyriformis TaxID=342808 RepID=A0ABQ8UEC9_9EUKA|nr:putative Vacuolar protein sorting-associated protein 13a [Paratrimastix pyriformis]
MDSPSLTQSFATEGVAPPPPPPANADEAPHPTRFGVPLPQEPAPLTVATEALPHEAPVATAPSAETLAAAYLYNFELFVCQPGITGSSAMTTVEPFDLTLALNQLEYPATGRVARAVTVNAPDVAEAQFAYRDIRIVQSIVTSVLEHLARAKAATQAAIISGGSRPAPTTTAPTALPEPAAGSVAGADSLNDSALMAHALELSAGATADDSLEESRDEGPGRVATAEGGFVMLPRPAPVRPALSTHITHSLLVATWGGVRLAIQNDLMGTQLPVLQLLAGQVGARMELEQIRELRDEPSLPAASSGAAAATATAPAAAAPSPSSAVTLERDQNGLLWTVVSKLSGQVDSVLGGNYFNDHNLHFEPFLEPWKCQLQFRPATLPSLDLLFVSTAPLNLNLTSPFVETVGGTAITVAQDMAVAATEQAAQQTQKRRERRRLRKEMLLLQAKKDRVPERTGPLASPHQPDLGPDTAATGSSPLNTSAGESDIVTTTGAGSFRTQKPLSSVLVWSSARIRGNASNHPWTPQNWGLTIPGVASSWEVGELAVAWMGEISFAQAVIPVTVGFGVAGLRGLSTWVAPSKRHVLPPYTLRNLTGCRLVFVTEVAPHGIEVNAGEDVPLPFAEPRYARHRQVAPVDQRVSLTVPGYDTLPLVDANVPATHTLPLYRQGAITPFLVRCQVYVTMRRHILLVSSPLQVRNNTAITLRPIVELGSDDAGAATAACGAVPWDEASEWSMMNPAPSSGTPTGRRLALPPLAPFSSAFLPLDLTTAQLSFVPMHGALQEGLGDYVTGWKPTRALDLTLLAEGQEFYLDSTNPDQMAQWEEKYKSRVAAASAAATEAGPAAAWSSAPDASKVSPAPSTLYLACCTRVYDPAEQTATGRSAVPSAIANTTSSAATPVGSLAAAPGSSGSGANSSMVSRGSDRGAMGPPMPRAAAADRALRGVLGHTGMRGARIRASALARIKAAREGQRTDGSGLKAPGIIRSPRRSHWPLPRSSPPRIAAPNGSPVLGAGSVASPDDTDTLSLSAMTSITGSLATPVGPVRSTYPGSSANPHATRSRLMDGVEAADMAADVINESLGEAESFEGATEDGEGEGEGEGQAEQDGAETGMGGEPGTEGELCEADLFDTPEDLLADPTDLESSGDAAASSGASGSGSTTGIIRLLPNARRPSAIVMQLILNPPLVLENQLPLEITALVEESQSQAQQVLPYPMPSGSLQTFYHQPMLRPLSFRLSFGSLAAAAAVHPAAVHTMPQSDRVPFHEVARGVEGQVLSTAGTDPAAPRVRVRGSGKFAAGDVTLFYVNRVGRRVRHLSIYVPYWLVNRTKLPLSFYQVLNLERSVPFPEQHLPYAFPESEAPYPLLYSYPKTDALGCKTAIRYNHPIKYSLSPPFTLDAVGTSGVITVPEGPGRHELALTITRGTGPFRRTTIATLTRRFCLISYLPPEMPVYMRAAEPWPVPPNAGKKDPSMKSLPPPVQTNTASAALSQPRSPDGEHEPMPIVCIEGSAPPMPYSWPVTTEAELKAKRMQFSFGNTVLDRWSSGVKIDEVGESVIALHDNSRPRAPYMARVEVESVGACLYVSLKPERPDLPPYMLMNCLSFPLVCWQEGCEHIAYYTVGPNKRVPFAWTDLLKPQRLVVTVAGLKLRRTVVLDKIKDYDPVVSPADPRQSVYLSCYPEGPIRVLRTASTPYTAEGAAPQPDSAPESSFHLTLQLTSVGLSLVHTPRPAALGAGATAVASRPYELAYASLEALALEYSNSAVAQTVELKIREVQIDNQMPGALYPVILGRSSEGLALFASDALPPAVHLSLARSKRHRDVISIEYASCLVQALNLRLEEESVGCARPCPALPCTRPASITSRQRSQALMNSSASISLAHSLSPFPARSWLTALFEWVHSLGLPAIRRDLTGLTRIATAQLEAPTTTTPAPAATSSEPAAPAKPAAPLPTAAASLPLNTPTLTSANELMAQERGICPAAALMEQLLPPYAPPPTSDQATSLRKIYVKQLHLQPLQVNVTFRLTQAGTGGGRKGASGSAAATVMSPLRALFKRLGVGFLNAEDAPIKMNALLITNAYAELGQLIRRIRTHYRMRLLLEAYKVLGSLEVLGNPVGLVTSLGSGVVDLFYEPYRGLTQSPKEFARGLGKGSLSLLKKSIFGIFDSASKITGAVTSGLALLSMDDAYIRQRQQLTANRPKVRIFATGAVFGFVTWALVCVSKTAPLLQVGYGDLHVVDGVGQGLLYLGRGLVEGVAGVVIKPVVGAQRQGVEGFVKGVGKGIVGVFVRPTAGVFDLATKTLEGIRNTTTLLDPAQRGRMRNARWIGADGVLGPFMAVPAQAQEWLGVLGLHPQEDYVAHGILRTTSFLKRPQALVVSTRRVVLLKATKRGCETQWQEPLEALRSIAVEEEMMVFEFTPRSAPATATAAPEAAPAAADGGLITRRARFTNKKVAQQLELTLRRYVAPTASPDPAAP